jgi:predicted ArsR family transcriptional regulator
VGPVNEIATEPSPPPVQRRAATLEEARALSHPLRLRILRLCLDESLTNKELASRLNVHPGTILHHVRTLVSTGFLHEEEWRRGPRGTTEKPYRTTLKSWRLEIEQAHARPAVTHAILDAVGAEIDEAGADAVVEWARMAMRLTPERLDELRARMRELIAQYGLLNEPDGDPMAMLIVLHRRPPTVPKTDWPNPSGTPGN